MGLAGCYFNFCVIIYLFSQFFEVLNNVLPVCLKG